LCLKLSFEKVMYMHSSSLCTHAFTWYWLSGNIPTLTSTLQEYKDTVTHALHIITYSSMKTAAIVFTFWNILNRCHSFAYTAFQCNAYTSAAVTCPQWRIKKNSSSRTNKIYFINVRLEYTWMPHNSGSYLLNFLFWSQLVYRTNIELVHKSPYHGTAGN